MWIITFIIPFLSISLLLLINYIENNTWIEFNIYWKTITLLFLWIIFIFTILLIKKIIKNIWLFTINNIKLIKKNVSNEILKGNKDDILITRVYIIIVLFIISVISIIIWLSQDFWMVPLISIIVALVFWYLAYKFIQKKIYKKKLIIKSIKFIWFISFILILSYIFILWWWVSLFMIIIIIFWGYFIFWWKIDISKYIRNNNEKQLIELEYLKAEKDWSKLFKLYEKNPKIAKKVAKKFWYDSLSEVIEALK